MKILHLCLSEKFTPPLIDFVLRNFSSENHKFLVFGEYSKFPYKVSRNTLNVNYKKDLFTILKELNNADKIILHSFTRPFLAFYFQPWLWKRGFWVIWGGDLYNNLKPKKGLVSALEWTLSKHIIKRLRGLVCFVKGDYNLATKTFQTNASFFECVFYRDNLDFSDKNSVERSSGVPLVIQVGNSASILNEHSYALQKLAPFKDKNIQILCPLSYHHDAGQQYANDVIAEGKQIFGSKFVPITDYLPLEEYLSLLTTVDIALFAHRRQQGLGNSITLLGSGKKVYMHKTVTQWDFFADLGVKAYDIEDISLDPISTEVANKNAAILKEYFSEENVIKQMTAVFDAA